MQTIAATINLMILKKKTNENNNKIIGYHSIIHQYLFNCVPIHLKLMNLKFLKLNDCIN
jgi:hypothetical protein